MSGCTNKKEIGFLASVCDILLFGSQSEQVVQ